VTVPERVRFPIEGMTCHSCTSRLTRAIRQVGGVESVRVDLGSDSATVGFDSGQTSLVTIGDAVVRAGYAVRIEAAEAVESEARRGLLGRLRAGRA